MNVYEKGDVQVLKNGLNDYANANRKLYGIQSEDYLNALVFCINIFNQINEADSVLFYGEEAERLIKLNKLLDSELDYGVTYCQGCAFYSKAKYDLSFSKAIESYEKVYKIYSSPGLSLISSLELIFCSAYKLNDFENIKKYAQEYLALTTKINNSSAKLLSALKMIVKMLPPEDASFSLMLLQKYGERFHLKSECSVVERIEFNRMMARNYSSLRNNLLAVDYIKDSIVECENWDSCPKQLWLEVLCESLEILSFTNLYDGMIDVATRILQDTEENSQAENYRISALIGLGIAYGHEYLYAQSIDCLMKALDYLHGTGQNQTPMYLTTIDILTGILIDAKEYDNCINIIHSTLPNYIAEFGENSERSAIMKERLGWAYYNLSDSISASKYFAECAEMYRNLFFQYSEYLSEVDLYFLFAKYNINFKQICVRASNLNRPKINAASYNAALTSKSFLLSSQNALWNTIINTYDKEIINAYTEYSLKRKEAKKYFNREIYDINNVDLILAQKRIISMLKTKGVDYLTEFSCTWKDVQAALPNNGSAIEFTSFTFDKDSIVYYAQILNKYAEYPVVIQLCSESTINEKLSQTDYLTSSDIYELIWQKIEPYIKGSKDVYFATDGILQIVPIEYVASNQNGGIVSDIWDMHRLSSTRELCTNKKDNIITHSYDICAYGGMIYSTDRISQGSHYSTTLLNRSKWDFLPSTLTEVENIRAIVKQNNNTGIFMIGTEGTEDSFKMLNNESPTIIHLATHGFYFTADDFKESKIYEMFSNSINGDMINIDLSLNRSGLLFSGAVDYIKSKSNPIGTEDGILTSYEISQLNLYNTELVVLSACNTGLGELTSDGVAGIQRGMKKAGVKSILMTLWEVEDEATQLLMTEFYNNYLSGKSKHNSLLAAQKVVRETPGFEDPEYWAAFILLDGLN